MKHKLRTLKWVGLFIVGSGLFSYMLGGFNAPEEAFQRMGIDATVVVQGYSHGMPVVRRWSDTASHRPLYLALPLPAVAYLRSGDRVIKVAGATRLQIVRDSNHVRITTEWRYVDPPASPLVKRTCTRR
ncbi:hypothetical protein [Hymenobacter sp. IS2118]|uniref:hypothetical protein n=1 Tax=Hymenobacter sp. IS2118 TaxID=1505605 RepID=UPI0012680EDA|nr:hypothetical protein [Hymenobacter sp. IS2118]